MVKKFRDVEWLDERLIGHSTAYRHGDLVLVEVRASGSVLLNGKEYILDQVIMLPVDKCMIERSDR